MRDKNHPAMRNEVPAKIVCHNLSCLIYAMEEFGLIPASNDARYNRGMKYRKLRIAWSVWWGVVAMLLCVLWVRSYWRGDFIETRMSERGWNSESIRGQLGFCTWKILQPVTERYWNYESHEAEEYTDQSFLGFDFYPLQNLPSSWRILVPHWFTILVTVTLATSLWIRWSKRFSLRTLLIATTLVSVALGLIVWASS